MGLAKKLRKKLRKMKRWCEKYPELFAHLVVAQGCRIQFEPEPSITSDILFAALAHGDSEHREWLKEAIDAVFNHQPVLVDQGPRTLYSNKPGVSLPMLVVVIGVKSQRTGLVLRSRSGMSTTKCLEKQMHRRDLLKSSLVGVIIGTLGGQPYRIKKEFDPDKDYIIVHTDRGDIPQPVSRIESKGGTDKFIGTPIDDLGQTLVVKGLSLRLKHGRVFGPKSFTMGPLHLVAGDQLNMDYSLNYS